MFANRRKPEEDDLGALREHLRVARDHLAAAEWRLRRLEQQRRSDAGQIDDVPEGALQPTADQEPWTQAIGARLAREPSVWLARAAGVGGLVLATAALAIYGDTPAPFVVWLVAALGFVATWAYGVRPRSMLHARGLALVGAVFVAGLCVRLFQLDRLALGIQGDESTTALTAIDLLQHGAPEVFRSRPFGIPTLGYVWFVPFVALMPDPILAVRATSAAAGAATVALVAVWGWTLGGPRLGVAAGAVMAVAHTALYLSHLGTSNSLAIFFATAVATLLTLAICRQSLAAAALAALAVVGAWCTWAGAREVLPLLALAVVASWRGRRRMERMAPAVLAAGGAVALLLGPALSVGADDRAAFMLPRSESSLTSASGWEHTAQISGTTQPVGILAFQIGRVLGAFEPETHGDSSPFYRFARPLVDPITVCLALLGCCLALRFLTLPLPLRRQPAWSLPLAMVAIAFLTGVLTKDPPDYPRLSLMLPALAVLAALPLAWLSARGRAGLGLTVAIVGLIALVNLRWFFVDYPREGLGDFQQVALVRLASRGPVYVVTPDFYFKHETLVLLDPQHRIQPPPPPPQRPDPTATWAALGPSAEADLAPIAAGLSGYTLEPYSDNAGRVVLYALVPSGAHD